MTPRATSQHHESFELRVLTALAMGASTPEEIAAGLTESPDRVRQTLEWAVGAETVSRLDLPGGATYSLSPKGLEIVGLTQGVGGAASPHGRIDPGSASPGPQGGVVPLPGELRVSHVDVNPVRRKVQWRHVGYAVGYVVIGLVLLLVQPVVGGLAILAGLALGAWSLRPLFAAGPARSDTP